MPLKSRVVNVLFSFEELERLGILVSNDQGHMMTDEQERKMLKSMLDRIDNAVGQLMQDHRDELVALGMAPDPTKPLSEYKINN